MDRLTVEGVAERAGVAKTTIYRRYRSKDELALAVLIDMVDHVAAVPDLGSAHAELVAFVDRAVDILGSTLMGRVMQGLVSDLATNPMLATAFQEKVVGRRLAEIQRVVERGIARGDLRPDADHELVNELVFGPVYYRLLLSGAPLEKGLAERIVAAVLPAFAPETRTSAWGLDPADPGERLEPRPVAGVGRSGDRLEPVASRTAPRSHGPSPREATLTAPWDSPIAIAGTSVAPDPASPRAPGARGRPGADGRRPEPPHRVGRCRRRPPGQSAEPGAGVRRRPCPVRDDQSAHGRPSRPARSSMWFRAARSTRRSRSSTATVSACGSSSRDAGGARGRPQRIPWAPPPRLKPGSYILRLRRLRRHRRPCSARSRAHPRRRGDVPAAAAPCPAKRSS